MEQPDTRALVQQLKEIERALEAGNFLVARAQASSTEHLDARVLNVEELPAISRFQAALQPVIKKHTTGRLLSYVVVYKNQVVFPVILRRTGQLELDVGPSLADQLKQLAVSIENRAQDRHVRNAGSQSAAISPSSHDPDIASRSDPGLERQEDLTKCSEEDQQAVRERFKLRDKLIDVLAKNPEVALALSGNSENLKSIQIPSQAELQRATEPPKATSTVVTGLVGCFDAAIGGLIVDGRHVVRGFTPEEAKDLIGKKWSFTVLRAKEPIRLSVFDWKDSVSVEQGDLDL